MEPPRPGSRVTRSEGQADDDKSFQAAQYLFSDSDQHLPAAKAPPPKRIHFINRNFISLVLFAVFPSVPTAPGMTCVGEDREYFAYYANIQLINSSAVPFTGIVCI